MIVEDLLKSGPGVLAPEVHVDRLVASDLGEGEGTHAREGNPVRSSWQLSK